MAERIERWGRWAGWPEWTVSDHGHATRQHPTINEAYTLKVGPDTETNAWRFAFEVINPWGSTIKTGRDRFFQSVKAAMTAADEWVRTYLPPLASVQGPESFTPTRVEADEEPAADATHVYIARENIPYEGYYIRGIYDSLAAAHERCVELAGSSTVCVEDLELEIVPMNTRVTVY